MQHVAMDLNFIFCIDGLLDALKVFIRMDVIIDRLQFSNYGALYEVYSTNYRFFSVYDRRTEPAR
jgi:hypothetical protein